MAEPYSPSEARLFPNSVGSAARLSTRDEPLPPYRSSSRSNSLQADPYASPAHDSRQAQAPGLNPQMQKIKQTQAEIEIVKEQLHKNIDAIQERGENLDNLQNKTDSLHVQSQRFTKQASAVRRKMWWKNLKWTICLGILLVVIVAAAVGGGIKGHQVTTEHHTVTQTQTVAAAATSG